MSLRGIDRGDEHAERDYIRKFGDYRKAIDRLIKRGKNPMDYVVSEGRMVKRQAV